MTKEEVALRLTELWVDRQPNDLSINAKEIAEIYKYVFSEIHATTDRNYIKKLRERGIL